MSIGRTAKLKFVLSLVGVAIAVPWAAAHKRTLDLQAGEMRGEATASLVSLADSHSLGNSKARLTLVEFTDFECAFCAAFALQAMPTVKAKYVDSGKLLLVVFQEPLPTLRRHALLAAEAAECADRQGRFWPVHDEFFRHQAELDANGIRTLARAAGATLEGPDGLDSCLAERRTLLKVASQAAVAFEFDVRSTPTFLLGYRQDDGQVRVLKRFSGSRVLDYIESVLPAMLASGQ